MLVAMFAAMSMVVNAETIGDFGFNLDPATKTAELTEYFGSATEVVIPESVTYGGVSYSVVSLGDWAFEYSSNLESVIFPSTLTHIGNSCFVSCKSLKSIEIPSSVIKIETCCFSGCTDLESITVDKNNTVYDSRDNCNAIIETSTNTLLHSCKATVIPQTVRSLGESCFDSSTFTSIVIPSSVTSLGDWAFGYSSNLESIVLPSTLTSIGEGCFWFCEKLSSIEIPSSVTSLGKDCFGLCSSLSNIKLPSTITSLSDGCFAWCSSLSTIEIPTSVTYFGDMCFAECSALEAIDIPSSVTRLGDLCFAACSALETIKIPSSVTELGEYCFQACKALKTAKIPSSVNSIGNYCFKECTSLETMTCEIPTAKEGEFFTDSPIEQATLYVTMASLESYKTTSDWNRFGTILPITSTDIEKNTAIKSNTIDAIYDLEGNRNDGVRRGVNIIRMTDGKTKKVMMK